MLTEPLTVFLFDVLKEGRMFREGGLKRLLENRSVVKVMHSGKNDADAVYCQHGVQIQNVHDTQVAHMEVQRAEGDRLPTRKKLEDICEVYCPQKASLLGKDIVKIKCNKTEGEYWAKRPLTEEMKEYASNDVIALIPEVYTSQKQVLAEKGLTLSFQTRVEQELRSMWDPQVRETLIQEEKDVVKSTLKEFSRTASRNLHFGTIEDEHVIRAFELLRLNELPSMDLPPIIKTIKLQEVTSKIDKIEEELRTQNKAEYFPGPAYNTLNSFIRNLDEGLLKTRAQSLLKQVKDIALEDIKRMYTFATPRNHLANHEQKILSKDVRPPRGPSIRGSAVNPLLLDLHWKVDMGILDDIYKEFTADPAHFTNLGYVNVLKFFVSGNNIPTELKAKANMFLSALENAGKLSGIQGNMRGASARR